MQDPYFEKMEKLRRSVLEGPGSLEPSLRQAAAANSGVPGPLAAFVDKIHRHAYKITERDLAELRNAGYTEDQIFELTVSTATGAALKRLHRGLEAIGGGT